MTGYDFQMDGLMGLALEFLLFPAKKPDGLLRAITTANGNRRTARSVVFIRWSYRLF
jgi:hypothetical protein